MYCSECLLVLFSTCGSEVVQGKRRVYVCIVVSVLAGAVQHVW